MYLLCGYTCTLRRSFLQLFDYHSRPDTSIVSARWAGHTVTQGTSCPPNLHVTCWAERERKGQYLNAAVRSCNPSRDWCTRLPVQRLFCLLVQPASSFRCGTLVNQVWPFRCHQVTQKYCLSQISRITTQMSNNARTGALYGSLGILTIAATVSSLNLYFLSLYAELL